MYVVEAMHNQAVKTGGLVFLAGQIPLDPATNALVEGGIARFHAEARLETDVPVLAFPLTFVQHLGVVGEVRLENVQDAIAVVVSQGEAHAGLLLAVFVISAPGHHGHIGERPIMIIVE